METLREVISGICLVAGSLFAVIGGLGIVRLPDFYTRLHGGGYDGHARGRTDPGRTDVSIGGVVATAKLLMILVFLLICSPTSCHALAQSAVSQGLHPLLAEKKES